MRIILGIDIERWEELLPHSNLAKANGSLKLGVNVETRRSGDLAFVMMLQGSQSYAPSKCHECDSRDFKSAADDTGVAYTHERVAQENYLDYLAKRAM